MLDDRKLLGVSEPVSSMTKEALKQDASNLMDRTKGEHRESLEWEFSLGSLVMLTVWVARTGEATVEMEKGRSRGLANLASHRMSVCHYW